MFSYYQILEIDENATSKEIKKAYKRMAKKYHPDVNSEHDNAEEFFKLVVTAYENLSDEYQRSLYDAWLFDQRNPTKVEEGKKKSPLPKNYEPVHSKKTRVKEEREVIQWGVIFGLGFLILIQLFITVNNFLKDQKLKEQIAREQQLLDQVYFHLEDENLGKAFKTLEDIRYEVNHLSYERRHLYDSLYFNTRTKSEVFFAQKEYYQLHDLLKDIRDSTQSVLTEQMLWQLAISQFNIQEYAHSAVSFRKLLQKNKWNYTVYPAFSEIYSSGLNQPEKAIEILTEGVLVTTEEYTSTYGGAYAVILDGEEIPDSHFVLYFLRARLLMKLKRYTEVARDLKWALRLRPKHARGHFLLGVAFYEMGQKGEACEAWKEAERLGHLSASSEINKNCFAM